MVRAFRVSCGADGVLYDWADGLRMTADGVSLIPEALLTMVRTSGTCAVCARPGTLVALVCLQCFHEGPDHADD